jgi:gas vesicle protein
MNIFEAYLKHATAIFIVHLLLLAACAYCLVKEYFLLRRERAAFGALEKSGFTGRAGDSETSQLALLTAELSSKGQLLSADAIRWRLLRLLVPYESITGFCLNAFVVSGLLGTLYNLWRLGPQFWANLLKGSAVAARAAGQVPQGAQDVATQVGQPAIGIAFAASVFGLSTALLISFIDSFFIRQPRESFVTAAAAKTFAHAAKLIPPTEGAAVAKALDNFYRSSDSFLNRLKTDHEKLSTQFTKQIQDSSAELVDTLDKISGEWKSLSEGVATEVRQNQAYIGARLSALGAAVSKTEETLAAALPSLAEAEKLAGTLDTLRLRAASLQGEIATKFGEYSGKWREDLDGMTRTHVEHMESVYQKGWSQYSKESGDWHEKNVAALKKFADNIGTSVSQWNEERAQAKRQVDELMSTWRRELGTSLTGLGAGLADLNAKVGDLTKNSTQLATSNDIALRHLRELQSAVASFDAEILRDTPLGRAIVNFNTTVAELKDVVAGIDVSPPTVYANPGSNDALVEQILKEVRRLAASVDELKGQGHDGLRRAPRADTRAGWDPLSTSKTLEQSRPETWGGKVLRFLRLRR